jgi:hypothetical protein
MCEIFATVFQKKSYVRKKKGVIDAHVVSAIELGGSMPPLSEVLVFFYFILFFPPSTPHISLTFSHSHTHTLLTLSSHSHSHTQVNEFLEEVDFVLRMEPPLHIFPFPDLEVSFLDSLSLADWTVKVRFHLIFFSFFLFSFLFFFFFSFLFVFSSFSSFFYLKFNYFFSFSFPLPPQLLPHPTLPLILSLTPSHPGQPTTNPLNETHVPPLPRLPPIRKARHRPVSVCFFGITSNVSVTF